AEQHEAEREAAGAEDERVPLEERAEVDERVRLAPALEAGAREEQPTHDDERDDGAGTEPISALALIERGEERGEPEAEEQEPAPGRFAARLPRGGRRIRREADVDEHHHHDDEDAAGPEDPLPRPVLDEPALERRSQAEGREELHRVGADAVDR